MQSAKACCSKAHRTASHNLAIESGLGYSELSVQARDDGNGKEASAASKRAKLPSNCSNGSAASARFFMLIGVGLNPCRLCSSVGAAYDAA
eukprot:2417934-Pleurochrysis_carterae.AAC.2